MDILGLVFRWLHILSAVALGGGVYFWSIVVVPASRNIEAAQRDATIRALVRPWSRVVMITTAFLLVSGLVNLVRNIIGYEFGNNAFYHTGGLIKLVVGMIVFFLAARFAGRSEGAERMRRDMGRWSTINAILVTLLILVGGWMKFLPREAKSESPSDTAQAQMSDMRNIAGHVSLD